MSKLELKKSRKFRSLTVTLAIAFLALSAVVLVIVSSLNMYFNFQNQRKVVANQQQFIAKEAANSVKGFIGEKFGVLATASSIGSLAIANQEAQKLVLEKLLGLEPAFRQLVLLNAQEQELQRVARVSNLVLGQLTKQVGGELFLKVSQGKTYISSIYINEVTSEPMVIMAAPVTDVLGDFKGILMAEVNLKFMWDLVGNMKIGKNGLAYVVDRQGNLIAFGDISRVLRGENLIQLKEVNAFVNEDVFAYKIEVEISKGIQGTYVVANHAQLGIPDWAVVVELPALEAYETVAMALRLSVLILLLSFALAIIAGIYLSKRISKPIIDLRDATRKISKGDLSARIKTESKNEIGELAISFNQMVEDLNKTTVSRNFLIREMTERKKAEEAVRQSEQRFRQVTESAGEWIWEIDSKGLYTYVSLGIERMLGYKPEEVVQKKYFYDLFAPDVKEELKKATLEAFAKKAVFKGFINSNLHKNGNIVILETNATPIVDDKGNLRGYRGADKNITERRKAEQEREALIKELKESQELLLRQKQQLEDSRRAIKNVAEDLKKSKEVLEEKKNALEKINTELDDFTYIVSHDLKEPLRSIDAFSKFILDDNKDKFDEQNIHYLGRIRVNATKMQSLIEDLLEISRLERRRNPFELVHLEELINDVKLRLEFAIKQKNVQIIIRDKLPMIFCDQIRLAEVFINLFSNAIKFNDRPNPYIEIGYSQKGGFYKFYVKDNGPGVEERYFDKIFEIFQRLGRKEEHEGTGAGLTIVKKIIEMHRGKIWVESKLGEGTTFYFTLPKDKEFISGKKKIGEILVEKKLVAEEDVKQALKEQERSG